MVNFNQNKSFVGDLNALKIYSIMGAGMELTSDKDHAVDKSDSVTDTQKLRLLWWI